MNRKNGVKTLVVAGGRMDGEFALSFLHGKSYDKMIAVDGGLRVLHKIGVTPTDIAGDFDTVEPELLSAYGEGSGVNIRRFNPQKDDTDSEIAVNMAIEYGSTQIDIIGGTGGRLDHTIGNIRLLGLIDQAGGGKVEAFLYDHSNRVRLVRGECVIKREEVYGKYVSLLPYTQKAEGITLEGFRYPLKEHTMELFHTPTLGISNEIIAKEGRIICKKGVLLMIESRD